MRQSPPHFFLSAQWKSVRSTAPLPAVKAAEEGADVVPIIICSSEERMGATMAVINSIYSNTDARLFFYIVTLRDAVKLTRFVALFFPSQTHIMVTWSQHNFQIFKAEFSVKKLVPVKEDAGGVFGSFQAVHRED